MRTFNKEIIQRLDALQLWCYRKMLKIKYVDHVTNEKVKKILEVKQRWSEELAKRKLRFAGHIMRGRCGSLVQLVLEGTVEGKRDRGRQRRVWADDVKNWSGSGSVGEAKRKSGIRVKWRTLVHNLQFEYMMIMNNYNIIQLRIYLYM